MVCNWPILISGYQKHDCRFLIISVIMIITKRFKVVQNPRLCLTRIYLTQNSHTPHPLPILKYITFTRFHQISYHQLKGEIVISHTNTGGINRVFRDEKLLGFVNQRTHHSRSSPSWRRCIYKSLLLRQPHVKSNRNHERNVNH